MVPGRHLTDWIVLVVFLLVLVACAPATPTPTPTATLAPTPTALPTSSATGTLVPTPTATATVTLTPTLPPPPTRTRTAAEVRAASLVSIPGFAWKAQADAIILTDAKGTAVAALDGGVLAVAPDAAATFATGTTAADLLKANPAIKTVQTPFFTDKDNQPRAESITLVTEKGEIKVVPIPRYATAAWSNVDGRIVVTSNGNVSSYIDRNGNKDFSPSFPKILVETPEDEKRVRDALTAVAPIILDMPNFVDRFYSYPRAPEFKKLIETNYPGVNFDDLLKAIKETSVAMQEDALRILAIGTPDKIKTEYPGQFPKISDQNTQFYWNGRLNNSPINIPSKNVRDTAELYGGLLKEYFSFIAGEALKSPTLYAVTTKRSDNNGQLFFTNVIERFGAFAVGVKDLFSLPVQVDQKRRFDYAFKPDSELIFR